MMCPKCGKKAFTIDSRQEVQYRKRRYQCTGCKHRFNTIEIIELNVETINAIGQMMNYNAKFRKIINLCYLKLFEPETYRKLKMGVKKNENGSPKAK